MGEVRPFGLLSSGLSDDRGWQRWPELACMHGGCSVLLYDVRSEFCQSLLSFRSGST